MEAVKTCKHCRNAHSVRDSAFCSIQCRIAYNDATDTNTRPICSASGCDKPVRTKRGLYCRDHQPVKIRVKPVTPSVPPGAYECHWCGKPLKPHQVRVNAQNEDYSDQSTGNIVTCCEQHFKGKQAALFFLDSLTPEKFNEFGSIIISYRRRHGFNR